MTWQEIVAFICVVLVLVSMLSYVFLVAEREHKEKVKKDTELIETLKAIRNYLEKE